MDFSARLSLLKEANLLSSKNCDDVQWVICFLERQIGVVLEEENAAALVTHLCMALARLDKGESVSPLNDAAATSVRREKLYPTAFGLSKEIQQHLPQIDDAELDYLCIHITALISARFTHFKEKEVDELHPL